MKVSLASEDRILGQINWVINTYNMAQINCKINECVFVNQRPSVFWIKNTLLFYGIYDITESEIEMVIKDCRNRLKLIHSPVE